MSYQIEYTVKARLSLRELQASDRATILDTIGKRLLHQAEEEVTNRKRLRPNKLGVQWELRVGNLRVFYNVEGKTVNTLLIVEKRGNELYMGKEKIEL